MLSNKTNQNLSSLLEDIAFMGFASPEALQTANGLIWDHSNDIKVFDPMTAEAILYIRKRIQAINATAASMVVFVLVQIFGVLPFNLVNIFVIFNKKELWTQVNVLMCINSTIQLVCTKTP